MLIRNVAPEKYGGGETYQVMLAEELQRHGMRPVIVTSSLGLIAAAKKAGIEVVQAPYLAKQNFSGARNLLLPIYYIWQLKLAKWYRRLFMKYRPSVINVQSRDDWIAATKAGIKQGVRVLWTDHMDFRSWVMWNIKTPFKNPIGKWILKWARRADQIIMISDFERKWFEKQVAPEKFPNLITVKNGVRDAAAEFRDIKTGKESFCYIGRIEEYKGVKELIRAFLLVSQKHPKARLNIYGEGPELENCQKLAQSVEAVRFHGFTDQPLKAMAENEIFVLPSYREGLSLALLDAAMLGKEIIASSVDGNPEVVVNEETGLLVPAKNVKLLAAAMEKMLNEPETAKKYAKNARKLYEKSYNFEKIFEEQMLKLYKPKESSDE